MKHTTTWFSYRLGRSVRVVRWGHFGLPVLLFPTAGGDAEEAERMLVVSALSGLIDAGKVKLYSTDSIPAAERLSGAIPPEAGGARLGQYDAFLFEEALPAIRADYRTPAMEIITAGASIGAFHALAAVARHPDVVRAAVCMSGTYDVERLLGIPTDSEAYFSLPLAFLPNLEGPPLHALRRRFVILAHGKGKWEEPAQSWRVADLLGAKGVPNRVDEWGEEWGHDWPTWRAMLPKYLAELTAGT